MVNYRPFAERTSDPQYRRLLRRIHEHGELVAETRQGVAAITLIAPGTMHFDLANGFPVITNRSVKSFWNKGIGELCAFINGVTTADELADFGADWWGAWTTPEKCAMIGLPPGNIGPASYGGVFHDFPTLTPGERFDQFQNMVEELIEIPWDRTIAVTNWMPKENARGKGKRQSNTIAPCHGDLNVFVINGRLHLHMKQRSGDTPVGVPSNMIQYAALMLMLEHLTGHEAGVFHHHIVNGHYYTDQVKAVREMIRRPSLPFPTVRLTEAGKRVTRIHDFRREHFELTDYHPLPSISGIPVAT